MSDLSKLIRLEQAVKEYLDDFYQADLDGDRIPWPTDLEILTGWEPDE